MAWTTTTLHGPPSGSRLRLAAGWRRLGGLMAWTTTTLHGPPSGSRLRLAAGWRRLGGLLAWTTSTLHGPPSGSRLWPAAAWWFTGLSHPAADLLLAVGGGNLCATCRRGSSTVFWPLPGSRLLSAVAPPLLRCPRLPAWLPSISTIFPTGEPITSPARAAHTHICGLDKTPPPPKGRGGPGAFMAWATVGLPSGGVAK